MRKVVTTYINPDMDGISLMYAYTEFLRKKGEDAEYYFEGTSGIANPFAVVGGYTISLVVNLIYYIAEKPNV